MSREAKIYTSNLNHQIQISTRQNFDEAWTAYTNAMTAGVADAVTHRAFESAKRHFENSQPQATAEQNRTTQQFFQPPPKPAHSGSATVDLVLDALGF
jgi:hypothetical protein